MPNFNKVILAGHLTRDPELKKLPNTEVVEFGIAINRKWRTQGGEDREEVVFVDVAAFGKVAELINTHFVKGKPILLEGRLKFDQWEDKQTGAKRSKLSVVADSFQFIESSAPDKSAGYKRPASKPTPTGDQALDKEQSFKDDDIPF